MGVSARLPRAYALVASSKAEWGPVKVEAAEFRDPEGRALKLRRTLGTSEAHARSMLRERWLKTSSVYKDRKDPYFQVITQSTHCPEKFQPNEESPPSQWPGGLLFSAFANGRDELGACTEDTAKKKAIFAYFLCENALLEAEAYIPLALLGEADLEGMKSFACQP